MLAFYKVSQGHICAADLRKRIHRGEIRQRSAAVTFAMDAFLQALADDFEAHGKGVVAKVRTERPQDYLKIVASVMPKRMEVEDVGPPCRAADLSDDELAAIVARQGSP